MERLKHKLKEIPTETLTAWQQWAFPVMQCWFTWPRYNNIDYSYPRFSEWYDASRGKGFLGSLVYLKVCGRQQKSNVTELSCWDISIKLPPGLWFNYPMVFSLQLSQNQIKKAQQGHLQITYRFGRHSRFLHQCFYWSRGTVRKCVLKQRSSGLIRTNYLTADPKKRDVD